MAPIRPRFACAWYLSAVKSALKKSAGVAGWVTPAMYICCLNWATTSWRLTDFETPPLAVASKLRYRPETPNANAACCSELKVFSSKSMLLAVTSEPACALPMSVCTAWFTDPWSGLVTVAVLSALLKLNVTVTGVRSRTGNSSRSFMVWASRWLLP